MERLVKDFEENSEKHFNNHLYFYFFKSRFSLGSNLSTTLSIKHKGATIIVFSETEDPNVIKGSARNNGIPLKYPMNDMLKAGIKGLEKTMAGGHAPASGASFMKKDLDTFKKQVIEFVKSKISNS